MTRPNRQKLTLKKTIFRGRKTVRFCDKNLSFPLIFTILPVRDPEKRLFEGTLTPPALFVGRDCKRLSKVIYGKGVVYPATPTAGKEAEFLRFTIARHSFVISRYLKESEGFVERVGRSDIGRRSDDLSL